MTLKLQFGKAFVSKPFLESHKSIFEGAALYENIIKKDHFELDLYEFFSLVSLHALSFQADNNEIVFKSSAHLLEVLNVSDSHQKTLFLLHLDLRRKGWRIRRGMNYGADFLLYDSDPNSVHSKFAVFLFNYSNSNNPLQWNSLSAMNRVCGTAKKTMLIALPGSSPSTEAFQYIQIKRWVPESNRE